MIIKFKLINIFTGILELDRLAKHKLKRLNRLERCVRHQNVLESQEASHLDDL